VHAAAKEWDNDAELSKSKIISYNNVNKLLRSLFIASDSTLSILKLEYLIVNYCCPSKVNAIDKKIVSKIIAKISNKIDKKELQRVRMQIIQSFM